MSKSSHSGNIKVFCRFRPLNPHEKLTSELIKLEHDSNISVTVFPQTEHSIPLTFTYDYIFTSESTQEDVFTIAAKPIIEDVIQGFNGTIFAYGQTASGKTHTMTGHDIFDPYTMGIVPRMISKVFDSIESADENVEFAVKVSYCELYLEKINDLVEVDKKALKIRQDRSKGVYIANLSEHYVASDFDVFELLRVGTENRQVSCNKMNTKSSRSHTLFSLTITQNNALDLSARVGRLYLVDLAGSERVSKTNAEGQRLKELKTINKSLNTLGQVINQLTDGKASHVPYRDSKLTRILQDSLGGNSKTAIIITCSPALSNESETISTLRFGFRAKSIKNKPKVNRELTMAELKLKLAKIEEELRKKALKISTLEQAISQNEVTLPIDTTILTEHTEESDEFKKTDTEDFFAELEDGRNKLTTLVDENFKYKTSSIELKSNLDQMNDNNINQTALISVLEMKIVNMETAIYNKVELTSKLSIEKDVLTTKIEEVQNKKIELERIYNEKLVESNELKFQVKMHVGDDEISSEPVDLIEQLKNKLMSEQQKYKKNQTEMQGLQIRLNQALQELTREKRNEEKELLNREIQARNEKIKFLEDELETITENHRSVKKILSEDEETLKQRTDELERTLDELTNMYKQLLAKQSSVNIEKQLNIRKITRLNEKIKLLEDELKTKREQLMTAEVEANRFLDDMASQSIFNRIKVPIKGGGGKGVRASMANRLSIRPNRAYASMVSH
ncbi:hypothetical protein SteCoe_18145 [Stentor coeruleus]|uniref:Kinesin-like protein n=1 Tax=Stentor coeruleus TaxID=5963 RepID=A0A1R2BX92_9CILI|nr:hypothetical protein SteCoe_18145 [Stentor coeruleus]